MKSCICFSIATISSPSGPSRQVRGNPNFTLYVLPVSFSGQALATPNVLFSVSTQLLCCTHSPLYHEPSSSLTRPAGKLLSKCLSSHCSAGSCPEKAQTLLQAVNHSLLCDPVGGDWLLRWSIHFVELKSVNFESALLCFFGQGCLFISMSPGTLPHM